jgi:hypothetical protein
MACVQNLSYHSLSCKSQTEIFCVRREKSPDFVGLGKTTQRHKSDLRDNFSPGKGAAAQEYFVYFKLVQRIPGKKFPQSAAVVVVWCCPRVLPRQRVI